MSKKVKTELCCLLHGKHCSWCENYFGCCDKSVSSDEGNLLCDSCWSKYIAMPSSRIDLDFAESVEVLKPIYAK